MSSGFGRKAGLFATVFVATACAFLFVFSDHVQHKVVAPLMQKVPAAADVPNLLLNKIQEAATGITETIKQTGSKELINLRINGLLELPEKEELQKMSPESLFQTYHSYLDNIDLKCNRKLRMGKVGDGGWEICDDPAYRPMEPCIVYSFGINNDFSFDDDISRVYRCSVKSFDPSMKQKSYQRSPLVYFLKLGIAGINEVNKRGWEMHTFGYFKNHLNHTNKVIDVVKMDVESSEWVSLPEMIKSGDIRNIKQLLMEYHGHHTKKDTLISELSILKDIHDAGFRKFYVHKNFHCSVKMPEFPIKRTSCYEIHYVNINIPR